MAFKQPRKAIYSPKIRFSRSPWKSRAPGPKKFETAAQKLYENQAAIFRM